MKRNLVIPSCAAIVLLLLCYMQSYGLFLARPNTPETPAVVSDTALQPAFHPIADRADVLIITSQELADAWQEFARWKTQTGRPAKIITVEQINSTFEGNDVQQKIRACCLQHIDQQQTKWVVLGGDSRGRRSGHVPDRDTNHKECKELPYPNIPTDVYYISDGDWDANNDGIYGVFSQDMDAVNYVNAKATLGRIPVRTANDVKAYTEKVIAYESDYPTDQFANSMAYTCPVRHAYPKLLTSMRQVNSSWKQGTPVLFFSDKTHWDQEESGDYDLTADNWSQMINQQRASKLHMHGHGTLPMWVLEGDSLITAETIKQLANKNAYPVITTVSCLTGQFDNRKDPSIVESILRQPDAGAIAVIAPSREGVPFFHDPKNDFRLMVTEGKMDGTTTLMTNFWRNALKENTTLGEAFRAAKSELIDDARKSNGFHMVQCEINLLGDPSLSSRPTPPENYSGKIVLANGKLDFSDFPGGIVCVWDRADQYHLVKTTGSGTASVDISGKPGIYDVSVSGPNNNIWTRQIEVK